MHFKNNKKASQRKCSCTYCRLAIIYISKKYSGHDRSHARILMNPSLNEGIKTNII